MKNMEREKFEGSWKSAFDEAEVNPSDKVWTNIELDLEKAKGGDLKRRLLFYQMLAAASVVFAMAIGGIGYYYGFRTTETSGNLALENTSPGNEQASTYPDGRDEQNSQSSTTNNDPSNITDNAAPDERSNAVTGQSGNRMPSESESRLNEQPLLSRPVADSRPTTRRNSSDNIALLAAQSGAQRSELPLSIKEREMTPLYTPRKVYLNFEHQEETVDPVVTMLALLEQREKEVQDARDRKKDEKNDGENLWTSVGFAAGAFNTMQASAAGSPPSPGSAFAVAAPIVDQEAKASGYSYSMGINMGTRLSDRWVLQGGVNYLTHASEYVANNMVMEAGDNYSQQKFHAASTTELMSADPNDLSSKLVYSAPYSVSNSMRYLSIPMQAGYLLVDRIFGLQLNAGLATDLFLQNTISAESDHLAKTSQSAGSDSPYRSVNLSGLLGTEVSYRFGERYRVSVNPGIRYPFNTIYKSELGVESAPLTFDVGLRFRYIFK